MPDWENKIITYEDRTKIIEDMRQVCKTRHEIAKESVKKNINNTKKFNLMKLEMDDGFEKCQYQVEDAKQYRDLIDHSQKDAIQLVNRRVQKCQFVATLMLATVIDASMKYDQILTTKAQKSLVDSVVINILISFLPELKIFERGFKLIAFKSTAIDVKEGTRYLGVAEAASIITKMRINMRINEEMARVSKFVDRVVIKDGVRAARNTVSSNNSADLESQLRHQAFQAKNKIFQEIIATIMSKLIDYNTNADKLYDTIPYLDANAVKQVSYTMELFGMIEMNLPSDPNLYEKLSDQILYNMLKAYAGQYCSVALTSYGASQSSPQLTASSDVEGLDKSQKQMIYDKFGSKVWQSKENFHSIDDTLDLVRYWGVKVNRETWDPLLGRRKVEEEIV